MPNRMVWNHHAAVLGLLLLSILSMQGCLGVVWLGGVGFDRTRTSDIEFQSFENSWLGAPHNRQHQGMVKSIAVMPFDGDPVMAERWAAVFREITDLRVMSPSDAIWYGVSDHGQTGPVQRRSAESQMNYVLIGKVSSQEPVKGFAGLKERFSQRLYLYLMSGSGALMWKTELPYTIVKGAKDLDEEMVTTALLTHVRTHANELELAELVAATMQSASPPPHAEFDHHRAQLLPELEQSSPPPH